jgi:chromosome segregation ATPase
MKSFKRESTATTGGLRRSGKLVNDEYSDSIGFDTGEDALSLITKYNRLDKDMERRKISYASREEAYKQRIVELEEEISNQSFTKKTVDPGLSELKAIKAEILESVEMVQDRTARIMQEQERDLLRSFRARLFDVQTELEKEKSKRDDGLAAWRERHSQLEAELEWASEVSNRLDKVNYTLTKENNDLKAKFQSQEQDRKLFIELLVSLKKDNALWRSKINEMTTENEKLKIEVAEQLDALTGNEKTGVITKAVSSVNVTSGLSSPNAVSKDPTQVRDPLAQQRMESEEKYVHTIYLSIYLFIILKIDYCCLPSNRTYSLTTSM